MPYEEDGMRYFTGEEFDSMSDEDYQAEAKGAEIRMYLDKGFSYESAVRFAENPELYEEHKREAQRLFGYPGMTLR